MYFPLRPCLNFDSGKNGSFINELHRYLKTFECKLSSKRIVLKDNQTCGVPRAAYFVRIQNTNKKYNYKYWTTDHVRPHVLQYFVEKRFLPHLVFCYIIVQQWFSIFVFHTVQLLLYKTVVPPIHSFDHYPSFFGGTNLDQEMEVATNWLHLLFAHTTTWSRLLEASLIRKLLRQTCLAVLFFFSNLLLFLFLEIQ